MPPSEGCGPCLSGYHGFGPLIPRPLPCTVAGPAGHAPAPAQLATLGCIRHTVVLAEVIQAFAAPENAVRMDEARDNACNDMGKMLQFVLPVATQIQQEVIKAYGFSCDGEGGSAGMGWSWGETRWVRCPDCRLPSRHTEAATIRLIVLALSA